jgi:hypothetical protein
MKFGRRAFVVVQQAGEVFLLFLQLPCLLLLALMF